MNYRGTSAGQGERTASRRRFSDGERLTWLLLTKIPWPHGSLDKAWLDALGHTTEITEKQSRRLLKLAFKYHVVPPLAP